MAHKNLILGLLIFTGTVARAASPCDAASEGDGRELYSVALFDGDAHRPTRLVTATAQSNVALGFYVSVRVEGAFLPIETVSDDTLAATSREFYSEGYTQSMEELGNDCTALNGTLVVCEKGDANTKVSRGIGATSNKESATKIGCATTPQEDN